MALALYYRLDRSSQILFIFHQQDAQRHQGPVLASRS
jgi:hypothetical protein